MRGHDHDSASLSGAGPITSGRCRGYPPSRHLPDRGMSDAVPAAENFPYISAVSSSVVLPPASSMRRRGSKPLGHGEEAPTTLPTLMK
eukprot:scaffold31696_cov139-Isochrysis_galbana.AAC.6